MAYGKMERRAGKPAQCAPYRNGSNGWKPRTRSRTSRTGTSMLQMMSSSFTQSTTRQHQRLMSYVASAPVVEYIAPATSHVTPASVVDNIAPTLAVDDVPSLIGEYISPAPGVYAAPVPVLEYIAPAPSVDVAPAPVGGCISPVSGEYAAPASVPVVEYISPAPMEFVEAALHEIDKEPCRDEIEELCCVVRMSQKRIWRRVWQSCSAPSDASKSERTWRALSARLCYEQESGKSECPDVWIRLPRHKRENS